MARSPKEKTGLVGIEPAQLQVPAMDRPSVAFALFLDNMAIEVDVDSDHTIPDCTYITCSVCQTRVVEVDDGDTMRVLFNTILAHSCYM